MPPAATADLPERIARECSSLPPAKQSEVLDFVLFIKHQETAGAQDADEEKWEQLLANPEKMANFHQGGQQALAAAGDEPLSLGKL